MTLNLKDAFSGEASKTSKFKIKLLKVLSEGRFLIADDSDYCELILGPVHPNMHHNLLKVNNSLTILNPKVDQERKELIIMSTTSIFQSQENQTDGKSTEKSFEEERFEFEVKQISNETSCEEKKCVHTRKRMKETDIFKYVWILKI